MSESEPQRSAAFIAVLIISDPDGLFAELRGNRPILSTAAFTLVTRFKDVIDVFARDDVFTVRLYAQRMDPVVDGPFMLARDGAPANWREETIMKAMLRPEHLPAVRAMAGQLADESLDACAAADEIETVSRLGREVPTRICGEYFGFPGPDLPTMYRWSKATQSDMFKNLAADPAIHKASAEAGQEMLPADDPVPNSVVPTVIGTLVAIDAFSQALTNPLLNPNIYNEETFSAVGMDITTGPNTLADIVRRNTPPVAPDQKPPLVTLTRTDRRRK